MLFQTAQLIKTVLFFFKGNQISTLCPQYDKSYNKRLVKTLALKSNHQSFSTSSLILSSFLIKTTWHKRSTTNMNTWFSNCIDCFSKCITYFDWLLKAFQKSPPNTVLEMSFYQTRDRVLFMIKVMIICLPVFKQY